jgi:glycosyltransferase involved in cell wall biosynthesis
MKIAINGLFLQHPATGTGQYSLHLLEALAAREDGHSYGVFVDPGGYRPAGLGERVTFREAASWPPPGAWRKLLAEQVGFAACCRRLGAQVAHVPYFAPPLVKPCPVVTTVHDLITLLLPEYRASVAGRAYNSLVSAAARRADAIIADSQHSARDIVRLLGVPQRRVRVVYLAAEPRFRPAERQEDLDGVRRRYGLPERFVLYIGGLNRHKNLGVLLQAFAAVRDRLPSAYTLAIAGRAQGGNPLVFPDLRQQARDLGLSVSEADGNGQAGDAPCDVRFLRFVSEEDKPLLYGAADLFVFPSLYEGFGLPPLEAMACGTPVVCSNAASLPEIVGDGGLLVDPADAGALGEAITAVLSGEELRKSLRARGLDQAARFSWRRTADETVAVYEGLAAARA